MGGASPSGTLEGMPPARRAILVLVAATVTIGVLTGAAGLVFHVMADRLGEALFDGVAAQPLAERAPRLLLIPALGIGVVGVILYRFPFSRVGGVREVRAALDDDGGVIPPRRVLNVVLGGLVLAFGGSVGPEGPMVQLGALVGSLVGQRYGINGGHLQTMVRAGAAAGIAAAFRSPAGGVLLTLEVLGARAGREIVPISAAAVVGFVVRTTVMGDAYPFRIPGGAQPLPLAGLVLVAPLMGVLAALVGHGFLRAFEYARGLLGDRWPLPALVAAGGLAVGAIGLVAPEVMSAGYPVVLRALHEGFPVRLGLALLLGKMLATCITFGSGAVGGLFAPTLVMGALFGGAIGGGLHALWPEVVPQPELFVLLGMIAMFGAVVKGAWSGLLMVADLSGAYEALLVPGLIVGGVACVLGWHLHPTSIFGLPPAGERVADPVPLGHHRPRR